MTDRSLLSRLFGAILAALAVTIFVLPGSLQATRQSIGEPVPAGSVTSEPVTSEPVTTEPITTEPVDAEPVTSEPDTDTDDAAKTASVIIGAIVFVALVGVAAVWMIRRPDGDDAPHPPPPNRDQPLPGHDLL
jgi:hypothetical protein